MVKVFWSGTAGVVAEVAGAEVAAAVLGVDVATAGAIGIGAVAETAVIKLGVEVSEVAGGTVGMVAEAAAAVCQQCLASENHDMRRDERGKATTVCGYEG